MSSVSASYVDLETSVLTVTLASHKNISETSKGKLVQMRGIAHMPLEPIVVPVLRIKTGLIHKLFIISQILFVPISVGMKLKVEVRCRNCLCLELLK